MISVKRGEKDEFEESFMDGNKEKTYPRHLDRCGSGGEREKSQAHHSLSLSLLFFTHFSVSLRFQLAISVTRTQALSTYDFFQTANGRLHTSYLYFRIQKWGPKLKYQSLTKVGIQLGAETWRLSINKQ